jgi:mRNA-degrading endonuclease RelE of RelBE toxin-antitoxin system
MTSTAPNGPPGWVVVLDKPAQKQLDKPFEIAAEGVDAHRTKHRIDSIEVVRWLTKHDRYSFRRRVGSYRILFNVDIAGRRVRIGAVERRTTTTYRKRRR